MAARAVAQQRRQEALRLLSEGRGTSQLVSELADAWGCSRRQARRYVGEAYSELTADFTEVEAAHMLAALIGRLERIATKAEQAEQFGAAVGACRTLGELAVTPHRNRTPAHFGRFGRSGSWS